MAKLSLDELKAAVAAAREALVGDPENETLKAELAKAEQALAAAQQATRIEVRVLVDHGPYKADTVAKLLPEEVEIAERDGWADADKRAVAFAKAEVKSKA
ncbi:hypothetical protein [Sphingobium mellinum]|uniref:hypothetical protein n=1 Tax=Sphingobium mellinum TaxID=1387166 RepID=UPI0030EC8D41